MPIPDDERFERYLRQFRPLTGEPLPVERRVGASWRWRKFALPVATTLALVVASLLAIHLRTGLAPLSRAKTTAGMPEITNTPPLTLGHASELLAHARSFQAVLDGLAFQHHRRPLPQGTRSALATLSKEDFEP